jgi:hypothetical protein
MMRQTSAEGVNAIIMQAHATLTPICTAEQTRQLAEFVDAWITLTEQIVKNAFQDFSETLTCHSTTHYLVEVRYSSQKIIRFLYKYQLLMYWRLKNVNVIRLGASKAQAELPRFVSRKSAFVRPTWKASPATDANLVFGIWI